MTLYEILKFNRELLNRLILLGFKPVDITYIDLYSEYEEMVRNGDKITYIVTFLSDKYHISERKVYTIIKYFKKDCTDRAV